MYSGGLGSWCAARRVIREHGSQDTVLLFADVKGHSESPHVGEDDDTYRFIAESSVKLGTRLVVVRDGRDIWQVFKDDRFLGNARLANCSKFLKQIPCREWLEANCDPGDTTVYVGIDWTEVHRLPAIKKNYLPYRAEAPLTEPPYLDKEQMQRMCVLAGMRVPRLYREGYPHNNCGGGCVRAGHAQFAKLLEENPERFDYWARKEQEVREHLGKDVAILRDRKGGESKPLPLADFRDRKQSKQLSFDELDFGGCGCFVD